MDRRYFLIPLAMLLSTAVQVNGIDIAKTEEQLLFQQLQSYWEHVGSHVVEWERIYSAATSSDSKERVSGMNELNRFCHGSKMDHMLNYLEYWIGKGCDIPTEASLDQYLHAKRVFEDSCILYGKVLAGGNVRENVRRSINGITEDLRKVSTMAEICANTTENAEQWKNEYKKSVSRVTKVSTLIADWLSGLEKALWPKLMLEYATDDLKVGISEGQFGDTARSIHDKLEIRGNETFGYQVLVSKTRTPTSNWCVLEKSGNHAMLQDKRGLDVHVFRYKRGDSDRAAENWSFFSARQEQIKERLEELYDSEDTCTVLSKLNSEFKLFDEMKFGGALLLSQKALTKKGSMIDVGVGLGKIYSGLAISFKFLSNRSIFDRFFAYLLLLYFAIVWSPVALGSTASSDSCTPPPQGSTIAPSTPFMLFGSDPVARINITEPLCVFLVSSDKNHLSKLMFISSLDNGTCVTVKASDFAHWNNSMFPWDDSVVSHGKYCFDDTTQSVLLDRGDLYTDLSPTSVRWRETILLFLEKSHLKGHCKEGNVYYPNHNPEGNEVSARADCPAFILTPTHTNKSMLWESIPGTVCPLIQLLPLSPSESEAGVPNAEVHVTTVQNGLRKIADPTIMTFAASNIPNSPFLRSAIMITANMTEWRPLLTVKQDNGDQTGPLTCSLSRELNTYSSGQFDSDPYGVEEIRYTFNLFFPDPEITFDIAPYDAGCVNLTFEVNYLDGTNLTKSNLKDHVVFPNVEGIAVEFHRTDPIKCASQEVNIRYSLGDSPPMRPTEAPLSSKCISLSPGAVISPKLPFMLFGSDNVSLITLREPTCVAVDSSNLVDMSPFALTSLFSNGSCSSIRWNDLSKMELFCFDATTTTVLLHRGDIFDGTDSEVHNAWRSVILMFLAKRTLKGECQDGNIVRVSDDTDSFNVSAACPAFVMMPNAAANTNTEYLCPVMLFNNFAESWIPQNVKVDMFTVPNGLVQLEDSYIMTYTADRQPQTFDVFLRNAVMLTTNVTDPVPLPGLSTYSIDGGTDSPLRCRINANTNDVGFAITDSLISSDPYGLEVFKYWILPIGGFNGSVDFRIEPYSDFCMDLQIICTYLNKTTTVSKNPHDSASFTHWSQIAVQFLRRDNFGCSPTSYISMRYTMFYPTNLSTTATTYDVYAKNGHLFVILYQRSCRRNVQLQADYNKSHVYHV
ncbi:hypothetical protein QR680_012037 [Steinernema hermaphroditum]|uniref:Uncharacterized protein n=1 Tax=Steinernema hermaphroditum TaxID=289476 RepID=A0AA39LZU3_9BILA|nr:hypothetical protein QR680_012037 [Steinernema hermaphroditum]